MFGVSNNPDFIALYFTDIKATASPYFEHIPLEQKSLRKFDYQQDIANLIKTYEKSSDIHHLQQMFERVVLVGEGYGAWLANYFAHYYGLRALLINPDIETKDQYLFQQANKERVEVMIELNKAKLSKEAYEQFFANKPENWTVDYTFGDCYGEMQDLQMAIAELGECGWANIDDGTWYDEY